MTVIDVSKRKSSTSRLPELDSLYVYSTKHKAKFTRYHQQGSGYRYTNHNAVIQAEEDEIYIYHMTVTIEGVCKGITIVTKNGKYREVQAFFKDSVDQIANDSQKLDKFKHAKTTPSELGILYTY